MGRAAQVRLPAEGSRRPGGGARPRRFRGRGVGGRAEVLLPQERGRPAGAGPGPVRDDRRSSKQGYTPIITPDVARVEVLEGIGFIPRSRPGKAADLHHRRHRPVPDRHGRDHARRHAPRPDLRRAGPADEVRRPVALLPHRGRRPRPRHARPLPRPPVHQGRDVRLLHAGPERGDPPGTARASRRRSSRASACRTTSSTPAPATSAVRLIASTTWKRGCRAAARAASTAR